MSESIVYYAAYSDGSTYRVAYDTAERKTYLATTDGGFMSVPYFMGNAEFVRYDFHYVPQPGLRGCDWTQNVGRLHANLALLTPPAKPATPPTPQTQPEDFRLHLEADSDPFRALQATGAKGEAEYRATRQRARQQALNVLNEPDTHKIQEARRIRNEQAAQMRPRGRGAYIIRGEE
jgi:hypothetical protein